MADPKYPVPASPAYRVHAIRAIQDEDYVSAAEVVNPLVEAVLESVEYVHRQAEGLAARRPILIPAAGWTAAAEGVTLLVSAEGVEEDMRPDVSLDRDSLEAARTCELCPVCETVAGGVRFWAKRAPAADLAGELLLIRPGGGGDGGSGVEEALPATDREVAEMLDSVFPPGGMTDEE